MNKSSCSLQRKNGMLTGWLFNRTMYFLKTFLTRKDMAWHRVLVSVASWNFRSRESTRTPTLICLFSSFGWVSAGWLPSSLSPCTFPEPPSSWWLHLALSFPTLILRAREFRREALGVRSLEFHCQFYIRRRKSKLKAHECFQSGFFHANKKHKGVMSYCLLSMLSALIKSLNFF